MIDLSIVIVSFNARADLERCLASLHAAPPAAGHEIVIVDNHSSDGSADAAEAWPGVRVIRRDENLGFARATNAGIRASRGENLLLLNSDTIVPAGAIDRLLDELRRDQGAWTADRLHAGRRGRTPPRPLGRDCARCDAGRVSAEPGRVLREAPTGLGAVVEAVPQAPQAGVIARLEPRAPSDA